MIRWSLRRRRGPTRDAEREYRAAAPAHPAGRPSGTPPAGAQPPDAQRAVRPRAGQPGSGPQRDGWFSPGWGRPGPPGPGGPARAGTGPYGADPYRSRSDAQQGAAQHGAAQFGAGQYGVDQRGAAQYGAGQYSADQRGPDQYGTGQRGGVDQYPGRQADNGAAAPSPLPPQVPAAPAMVPGAGDQGAMGQAATWPGGSWPDICDQFGLHLLVLAEQLRATIDDLEADEGDPERLKRLYQVDHAVTRMRRASRDLRTLAGCGEEELAGFTTSLLDIIRMAASAIERYTQVTIGRVTDLAVLGYAADDIGALMAALLDNATRYSPSAVTVSGHLLGDGGVMFRIEDSGIGIGAEQAAALNNAFAGPVPEVDERTGRHTGFPVVHRIARKHSLDVRLAVRPQPNNGTVAMVTLPPYLLCEVPEPEAQRRPAQAAASSSPQSPPRPVAVPDLPRGEPTRAHQLPTWVTPPDRDADGEAERPGLDKMGGELPHRERASLRGDGPRLQQREPRLVLTAEQQAAARRAFADDLSAFAVGAGPSGSRDPDGPGGLGGPPAAAEDEDTATTATEERAQP